MATKRMKCYCKSEYQDKVLGKQKRVFNKTLKTNGTKPVYRCTVCGKEDDE